MGGRHFRSYDGHSFDFNMGSCRYVLSQVCDEDESHPTVIIQQGRLHLRVNGVNMSLEMEHLGKVKVSSCTFTNKLCSMIVTLTFTFSRLMVF